MKKVSIITINLNNAAGLEQTIRSVIAQEDCEFEFVVVDGGSTDTSGDCIAFHRNKIDRVIQEKDNGIYDAMNKGIEVSTGEYLLFLNSGDYLAHAGVIKECMAYLDGTEILAGGIIKFADGKEHRFLSPEQLDMDQFLEVSLHHQATFVKRSVFARFGLYDDTYRLGGDYEFFVRVLLKHDVSYRSAPLYVCYFPTDGISNRKDWELINAEERKRTWSRHFSPVVLRELEEYKKLRDSREYRLGKAFYRRFSFLKKS